MKISSGRTSACTAASMSAALSTSTRRTPAGVAKATGPQIITTSAPASRAACATAKPILPELRLLMKRTGSMGSRVGPAVISTRRPLNTPLGTRVESASAASSVGSSMRPAPTSPQAWSPVPGPNTCTPRSLSRATLAWVAAFAHICWFMAGASAIGAAVARQVVASRSSARPPASRARKSARRRGDQHQIGPAGQFDVAHRRLRASGPTGPCAPAAPRAPGRSSASRTRARHPS